jgi:hypothetical protein
MRDAAGRENEVAHAGGELIVTDPDRDRPLQHVEALVLAEMRVRGNVGGHHVLQEG